MNVTVVRGTSLDEGDRERMRTPDHHDVRSARRGCQAGGVPPDCTRSTVLPATIRQLQGRVGVGRGRRSGERGRGRGGEAACRGGLGAAKRTP